MRKFPLLSQNFVWKCFISVVFQVQLKTSPMVLKYNTIIFLFVSAVLHFAIFTIAKAKVVFSYFGFVTSEILSLDYHI